MTSEEIRKANEAFLNNLTNDSTRNESTKQAELGSYMNQTNGYRMNDWEKSFVSSVHYKINLSEKQIAIVNKLYSKLIEA